MTIALYIDNGRGSFCHKVGVYSVSNSFVFFPLELSKWKFKYNFHFQNFIIQGTQLLVVPFPAILIKFPVSLEGNESLYFVSYKFPCCSNMSSVAVHFRIRNFERIFLG